MSCLLSIMYSNRYIYLISISGKYFWNNIPLSIRQKFSKQVFKNELKSY